MLIILLLIALKRQRKSLISISLRQPKTSKRRSLNQTPKDQVFKEPQQRLNVKKQQEYRTFQDPTKPLTLFQNTLNEPIALLANLSFSTGIFPINLKIANVILLFRKIGRILYSNYRPILRLSNLSTIIERLIHTKIIMFLNTNCNLFEKQFRFRHSHSTKHALIEITVKFKPTFLGSILGEYSLI